MIRTKTPPDDFRQILVPIIRKRGVNRTAADAGIDPARLSRWINLAGHLNEEQLTRLIAACRRRLRLVEIRR